MNSDGFKNVLFYTPVQTDPAAQHSSSTSVTGSHSWRKIVRGVALTTHPLPAPSLKIGTAVPARATVPVLARDCFNLNYVCYVALCHHDGPNVPVQSANRSGSAFWAKPFF